MKLKTLIVDDEVVSRKKMHIIMEKFGPTFSVASGRAALKAFKAAWKKWDPYDLITLDVHMPDIDGTEVLFEIREIERKKNVPKENRVKILMVTGKSDDNTVITCLQAGCDNYVVKPFNRNILIKKLTQMGIDVYKNDL